MTALLDGIYDGEMTIGELLGKGNFGIGTFDALDGEMIILDGVCYQLRGDGTATIADLDQERPLRWLRTLCRASRSRRAGHAALRAFSFRG